MSTVPEVAYYYPAPYWASTEGGWVKTLLLFFDRVAILLPDYMRGRHTAADPSLVEPLEDLKLLQVLEPKEWVDQEVTEQLASVVVDLLTSGAFDDLPDARGIFHELSYSRMGYGADVELGEMLVEELQSRGLATPSEDGVSVPLHPMVRTTILVILGQLARVAGTRWQMDVHPATNDYRAVGDLVGTLARDPFPSAGHVVALDLEPVSLELGLVPLDEVLSFRLEHQEAHKAYRRDLQRFLFELADIEGVAQRERLLLERREELSDAAHELQRKARRAFRKNLAGWSFGMAGAAWAVGAQDPLGLVLAAAGLGSTAVPAKKDAAAAYSYVFEVERGLAARQRLQGF